MNPSKVLKSWNNFKKSFPKIDFQNRMMLLNFDFNLDEWFHKDDLIKMKKHINDALKAINEVDLEVQK